MRRTAAALLVATLALTGCSDGDSDEWTTDDFTDLVAWCTSLSADGGSEHCPSLVRLARDTGCSVEASYIVLGEMLGNVTKYLEEGEISALLAREGCYS